MGRIRKGGALSLWMNGLRVGTWAVGARGEHELRYDPGWVNAERGRPLSLSMPLRPANEPYRGPVVRNFFENLLPDNLAIRERMQARFRTNSARAFELLAEVGRDCVGALQLLPEDSGPGELRRIEGTTLSDSDVARVLRNLTLAGRHQDDEAFRISIAGAQEKTALLWHRDCWLLPTGPTPTSHILKLPLGSAPGGVDLSTSVENEWLCGQLLARYGIPVAEMRMAQFEEQRVLVVTRFDRQFSSDGSWLVRIPQEDFAQVAGLGPEQKYESEGGPGVRLILQTLEGSVQAVRDRADFFRTQVLFWMLAAIDGHAKNFSLFLEARGRFRLTPRYDVLSAYPVMGRKSGQLSPEKVKVAMSVWGENRHDRWIRIRRRHFERTARDCGLDGQASQWIDELVDATPRVVDAVADALPPGFPVAVAEPVLEGLTRAAQRLG